MGVDIKYAHSECGHAQTQRVGGTVWEQHEVELSLAPLPKAADGAVLTMWVIATLAAQQGMMCSFEPVVCPGHAGSGMHFHMSPVTLAGDQIVHAPQRQHGTLTKSFQQLIAGLSVTSGALMAFGNRKLSSFVRITQGKEAPSVVFWGDRNRKALIRLPMVAFTGDGRQVAPATVEYRLGDGSALPHLLLAGIALSFAHGVSMGTAAVEERVRRTEAAEAAKDPASLEPVPKSFLEIRQQLTRHRGIFENKGGVFSTAFLDSQLAYLEEMAREQKD
mmetsp:Transcript_49063/g.106551  ORF Transcript_49063/g.106551 Transcript_49063/m.106551 type:complete len:276 (+) Transcript_49063:309-1136(+)